jgi:hypothetical protein
MAVNEQKYNKNEALDILRCRDFKKLDTWNGFAYINAYPEAGSILIEIQEGRPSEKHILLAIKVIEELDDCIGKAKAWLKHFNLKCDRWYPDALDAGFEVSQIYIGHYQSGGTPVTEEGFTITFRTINDYPCEFTVKFHENMWPFAVEEYVE